MRSPAWMVAYAVMLVFLGAAYVTLVFVGQWAALFFALAALVAVIAALLLTVFR